jgi:hypothetical protein
MMLVLLESVLVFTVWLVFVVVVPVLMFVLLLVVVVLILVIVFGLVVVVLFLVIVFGLVVVWLRLVVARPFVTGARSSRGAGRGRGVSPATTCSGGRTAGRCGTTTAGGSGSRAGRGCGAVIATLERACACGADGAHEERQCTENLHHGHVSERDMFSDEVKRDVLGSV